MKKIISRMLVVLALAISISAQENQPELIDEFGKMPLDELMARIEYLAFQISKTPNSKALIRIYGEQESSFAAPYNRGSLMKSIWRNNLRYPAEKLSIQFCNVKKESIFTRFFIVRENDKVETCDENLTFPKETVFFDDVLFYSPEFNLTPLEDIAIEHGPSQGDYSQLSLNILKRLLNDSPENKVYLIAYLQTNFEENESGKIITRKHSSLDKKSYANKMFLAARKELIKKGFLPSQIVTIDGGYVNGYERRLEFWFVPKGGEIPKPKPDYFPKKAKK